MDRQQTTSAVPATVVKPLWLPRAPIIGFCQCRSYLVGMATLYGAMPVLVPSGLRDSMVPRKRTSGALDHLKPSANGPPKA